MFKSLTGRAGIPRSQLPAPAFRVSENKVVLMVDCFKAKCKREAAGGGPWQLNTAPEPYLHSAMQQCRWLLVETIVSCRKKPLAPEQGVLWSWNGPGTCQISHHLLFQKSWGRCDRGWFKQQPVKKDMFLRVVLPWTKQRKEPSTDLCSGCQWWRPRSRARRCGTWPPSGPSAWPCCCGWRREELLLSRASLCPQPGSPPGTGYRSSPSPAEQAACGKHSCQSQHDREGERGQERRGKGEQSVVMLSLHWAYSLCGKLGHLPKKLLQLMAEPAESRPKASTAPASPPALPGTRLQVTAVMTRTAQMSHEGRHLVGTKTCELNMTQDFFSNQGRPRCLWTSSWDSHHGSHLRRELPGVTESTTTRFTLKAVWES